MIEFNSGFAELPASARRRSLVRMLGRRPEAGRLWIFGYGALLWDELAPVAERRPARLVGWHRALCVWSALARGTPERPGLCLGLDRGGACEGLALRIDGPELEERLAPIWERELWTDVYRPAWVSLESKAGPLRAVAFVVNRASAQYARGLGPDEAARLIAAARGEKGSARDYLARVLERLQAFAIAEPALADMLARVDALVGTAEAQ